MPEVFSYPSGGFQEKVFPLPVAVSQEPLGPAAMQINFEPRPKFFLLSVPVSQEPLGRAIMQTNFEAPPKFFSAPCPGFWGTTRASHHVNKLWGHRKVFAAPSPQVLFCSLSLFLRNPQQPFGAATVQINFEATPKFFLLPIPVSQDPLGPAIMQIHFWPPKVFLLLVPVSQEPLGPATMPLTLWARLKNGGRSARKTRKRHSRRGEVDKLQILI